MFRRWWCVSKPSRKDGFSSRQRRERLLDEKRTLICKPTYVRGAVGTGDIVATVLTAVAGDVCRGEEKNNNRSRHVYIVIIVVVRIHLFFSLNRSPTLVGLVSVCVGSNNRQVERYRKVRVCSSCRGGDAIGERVVPSRRHRL